ncbi:ferrous iron transporter B [Endozoicomonas sp. OPT23]|uniref:Fe(2+) transporter permease subunit FeoB n=1 Tax=Endozoicomonas sp. OPT23 TaxID=2072845 RepID=UPI00129AC0F5|nr:Fe(2+) transporter permease subunit FeoB [Endozoicomonas sp. OPT23]MRI34478.1 ferrous iron transporter B [Endozoicomonas sp. OPT23]
MNDYTFAIVGNPNCGKTTVFNALTGARQRVGNWPGVTVERRSGFYQYQGKPVEVVDLPGTYCLDVVDDQVSMDEKIARDFVLSGNARLIVNVIDASNLERNLYLTTQLLDMGLPVVIVLNMMDVAKEKGMVVDPSVLATRLGCPVHCVVASKEQGIDELKSYLNDYFENGLTVAEPIRYESAMESAIAELTNQDGAEQLLRWHAIKLLEGDHLAVELSQTQQGKIVLERQKLEEQFQAEVDILVANGRYEAIREVIADTVKEKGSISHKLTDRIDGVVLNRLLGLPVFFFIMYLMFMFSINIGSAFIDFFDIFTGTILVDGLGHWLSQIGSPDWLTAILANGIGGGIQTVSTFIPVIAFLFLFLSILEDSGYMARAAFVMDRLMRYLGLPGKAFVPMLVGFGCNVPAIMATRTLENQQDRMLTIAMAPFMSCGARLPVYALFAAAFFPASGQNVVFGLYLTGILAAVFTGLVLKKFMFSGEVSPFVMELPNYHLPSAKQVVLRTWDRLKAFLFRAGKAIVMVVVVLNTLNSIGTDGSFGNQDTESSVLSQIGQTITPAFAPMGMREDNWPAAVGIFTGILAKEAVVGTLDAMYTSIARQGSPAESDEDFSLMAGINEAFASIPANLSGVASALTDPLGLNVGNLEDTESVAEEQGVDMTTFGVMRQLFDSNAAVIAYLLLILLYTPCVAALGAIYRESGIRWTLFVAGWTFFIGYSFATIYYQLSIVNIQPLLSTGWVSAMLAVMALCFLFIRKAGQRMIMAEVPVSSLPESRGCH